MTVEPDLEHNLRQLIDNSAPPISLDEVMARPISGGGTTMPIATTGVTTTSTVNSGTFGRRLVLAAVLLAVLGVGAFMVSSSAPWKSDQSVEMATAAPLPLPPLELGTPADHWVMMINWDNGLDDGDIPWEAEFADGQGAWISEAQRLESGYYAIVSETYGPTVDDPTIRSTNLILRSDDGQRWEKFAEFESGSTPSLVISTISEHNGRIVAVGGFGDDAGPDDWFSPAAWTQLEDQTWRRLILPTEPKANAITRTVTATAEGFVAVGETRPDPGGWDNNAPLVWRSPDGLTWTQVPSTGFETGDQINDVAVGQDGTLFAGGSHGGGRGIAMVWYSTDDGVSWRQAHFLTKQDPKTAALKSSAINNLAVGPRGLLAIGIRDDLTRNHPSDPQNADPAVEIDPDLGIWSSPDGFNWTDQPGIADPDKHDTPIDLVWGPAGFLISTMMSVGDQFESHTWLTADGQSPEPTTFTMPVEGFEKPPEPLVTKLLATDDGYLGFAWRVSEGDERDPGPMSIDLWKLQVLEPGG